MDLTRITVFCFAASYTVALLLECLSLAGVERLGPTEGRWPRVGLRHLVRTAIVAGLLAHVAYLTLQATEQATPLSSPSDWSLLAALLLAALCLAASVAWPRWSVGLFLLPLVLGLIGLSRTVGQEPFAPERASFFWGQAHGWLLLLATVSVSIGFVAGLMYVVQNWRLKHKLPARKGVSLPSLEWLERVGGRSLATSAWLVAGGFVSGLVLSALKSPRGAGHGLWTDPVVLALGAMLAWLATAEGLRYASPIARRGRNVAFLTLASFALLAITLVSLSLVGKSDGAHGAGAPPLGQAQTATNEG